MKKNTHDKFCEEVFKTGDKLWECKFQAKLKIVPWYTSGLGVQIGFYPIYLNVLIGILFIDIGWSYVIYDTSKR